MAAAEAAKLFESIGLEPKTAASVASNAKLSAALRGVITEAGQLGGCDKAVGNLLYNMATKVRGAAGRGRAGRARARAAARHVRCAARCHAPTLTQRLLPRAARSSRPTRCRTGSWWRTTCRPARLRHAARRSGCAGAAQRRSPRRPQLRWRSRGGVARCTGAAAAGWRVQLPRLHRRAAR